MGIDIYASWRGMTDEEREARVTGFRVDAGNVGYLREAYHGTPYATRVLVPEAFESDWYDEQKCENCDGEGTDPHGVEFFPADSWRAGEKKCAACDGTGNVDGHWEGAEIKWRTLVARLPAAMLAALVREAEVYDDASARADLNALGIEPRAPGRGRPAEIEGPDPAALMEHVTAAFADAALLRTGSGYEPVEVPDAAVEALGAEGVAEIVHRHATVWSLFAFCALCREKEEATGAPCRIYASY